MSEFSTFEVQLVDGTRKTFRLPPGFELLMSTDAWQVASVAGEWSGPLVARGETAKNDDRALAAAAEPAWARFAVGDNGRPPQTSGEIVTIEHEPPAVPTGPPSDTHP